MSRVLGAQMEVASAYLAIRKAQKEAEKEKRPVPPFVFDKLNAAKKLALENLSQAWAAQGAMERFPPLRSA